MCFQPLLLVFALIRTVSGNPFGIAQAAFSISTSPVRGLLVWHGLRNGTSGYFASSQEMIHILRETHDTPDTVAYCLELAGGINRFRAPNYRAVWGLNPLPSIGAKFPHRPPPTPPLPRPPS